MLQRVAPASSFRPMTYAQDFPVNPAATMHTATLIEQARMHSRSILRPLKRASFIHLSEKDTNLISYKPRLRRWASASSDMGKYDHLPLADKGPINVPYTGRTLISDSYYNKGTAFSHEERHHLGLHGMLPTNLQVLDQQVARAYEQYSSFETDLEKNTFMTSMAEQNVVLYYRLIQDHLKEMFSIIYTPTESAAIENFSRIFRRPDGCFLPIIHPNEVEERLSKFVVPNTDDGGIDYIVVSDGEQILGIGDQGIGGVQLKYEDDDIKILIFHRYLLVLPSLP